MLISSLTCPDKYEEICSKSEVFAIIWFHEKASLGLLFNYICWKLTVFLLQINCFRNANEVKFTRQVNFK